jgi:hypothetical protein
MVNQSQLDKAKLVEIAKSSDTAKAVFESLMNRGKDKGVSDLKRLPGQLRSQGYEIDTKELYRVYKALEAAKLGKVVMHNGRIVRFEWRFSPRMIGTLVTGALGGRPVPTPPLAAASAQPMPVQATQPPAKADPMLTQILTNPGMTDSQKVLMLKTYLNLV